MAGELNVLCAVCCKPIARLSENRATTCCVAELATVTEIGRAAIAPKPALLTFALNDTGTPCGTCFGAAVSVPVTRVTGGAIVNASCARVSVAVAVVAVSSAT